jgi:hypothetical protein
MAVDSSQQLGCKDVLRAEEIEQVVRLVAPRHVGPRLLDIAVDLAQSRKRTKERRREYQRLDQRAAQQSRQSVVVPEHMLLGVALVAAVEFVAAVAGKQPLHAVLARKPRTVVGRNRRGVSERLIVEGSDLRHRIDDIGRCDVVLVVFAAEVLRGGARVPHFVVALDIEADRERPSGLAAHAAQHAADRRTVGAAGQKAAGGSRACRVPH